MRSSPDRKLDFTARRHLDAGLRTLVVHHTQAPTVAALENGLQAFLLDHLTGLGFIQALSVRDDDRAETIHDQAHRAALGHLLARLWTLIENEALRLAGIIASAKGQNQAAGAELLLGGTQV